MRGWIGRLADVLWPATCAGCDGATPAGTLCAPCRRRIVAGIDGACEHCQGPAPPGVTVCTRCQRQPPAFATVRALGPYEPAAADRSPLVRSVRALKYEGRRAVADDLGALLARAYPFELTALVIPVPLHKSRLRERGYNQAALLARTLARRRRLDCDLHTLARLRPTSVQANLADAESRRRNLAAAIAVVDPARIAGRTIVLVDDVVTTGATADACARALVAAGARRVDVLAVGRTP